MPPCGIVPVVYQVDPDHSGSLTTILCLNNLLAVRCEGRLRIPFQEVRDKELWNRALAQLGGSVLQSWEWGEFRRRHNWEPLRLLDDGIACQVLFRGFPTLGSLAYAPHGPLCADDSCLAMAAEAIADLARQRGAHTLRVEPRLGEDHSFAAEGFMRSKNTVYPRCTLVVDVLGDPDEQLKALPKDARYGIRRAGRQGVEAAVSTEPDDLEEFLDLLESTATRQGFGLRPREYHQNFMRDLPAHLILARREGKVLAGAVILTFADEAYYIHGASADEGENLYASYLVQFEALLAARRSGAKRYDMWGIPCNPHEKHPLMGVYRFKKKFGGRERRYAGSFEKSLAYLRSHLFQTAVQGYYAVQRLRGKSPGPMAD